MKDEKKGHHENNIPAEDLRGQDEAWSPHGVPSGDRILRELAREVNRLTGGSNCIATDHDSDSGMISVVSLSPLGIAANTPPPETSPATPGTEGEPTWVHEGASRYRLRGREPSVCVIVGWDRPMSTFFAQVWEVPEGGTRYEDGELLLWLGTKFDEIVEVDDLAEKLKPFVTVPERLADILAWHQIFF